MNKVNNILKRSDFLVKSKSFKVKIKDKDKEKENKVRLNKKISEMINVYDF